MKELAPWVALTLMPGMRPSLYPRLLEAFPDPRRALGCPMDRLEQFPPAFAHACSVRWREFIDEATRVIEAAKKKDMQVIALEDPRYPERLRQIKDPPLVLYVMGDFSPADRLSVAVVGTRRPSDTGRVVAQRIGRELALSGVTVVSGLARGIDSCAHRGALEAPGRTGAVLGSGLDLVYPRGQAPLFREIRSSGWVASEYPPGTPPLKWHFLERNRIISGISIGVVVVEAGQKSGALSTADHAASQGRTVMAVPGSVLNPAAAGCNELLAEGAGLVTCARDVLCFLRRENEYVPEIPGEQESVTRVTSEEAALLAVIGEGVRARDEVLRRSPFPGGRTNALISSLEIKGLVRVLPGGKLARC